MAIFFQEQPEPGELAGTLSIEGLLPAWCQQHSAPMARAFSVPIESERGSRFLF
jgi:hypothetical protein